MHGVGKGRKSGARNKTVAERIIDIVVMASGGNHSDTVDILEEHWNASVNRQSRGQSAVRTEFAEGNKFSDRYLESIGMNSAQVHHTMANLIQLAKNPKTVSKIDS